MNSEKSIQITWRTLVVTMLCMQFSCSTDGLKIFGTEDELDSNSLPAAAAVAPLEQEPKKLESLSKPIIHEPSLRRAKKSKRPTTKITNSSEKVIKEVDDHSSADEGQLNKSIVSRLPSRAKNLNVAADNSKINRLREGDSRISADQQGNSRKDIDITRKIRRAVIKKDGLSFYARNIKIITRDGKVVLKGPVRSDTERQFIENTAVEIAGIENVVSGIGVMSASR